MFYVLLIVLVSGKDICQRNCTVKESTKRTICGDDWNTYSSMCELKRANCLEKKKINFQFAGQCEANRTQCDNEYKPVCGTNNKTYLNLCTFKRLAYGVKTTVLRKKGPCKAWHGRECPKKCADIYAPVCGKDDKTYSSVCALKLVGCKLQKPIGLRKIGVCSKDACPNFCPDNDAPTCGSDGVMYDNECDMRLYSCRRGKTIVKMKEKSSCEKDRSAQRREKKRYCFEDCPNYIDKVCGSDFITYLNRCHLHKQSCESGEKIRVTRNSPCDTIENVLPKHDAKYAIYGQTIPI